MRIALLGSAPGLATRQMGQARGKPPPPARGTETAAHASDANKP
jgi:hypothetical protein